MKNINSHAPVNRGVRCAFTAVAVGLLMLVAPSLFAQDDAQAGQLSSPERVLNGTSVADVQTVSIDLFEDPTLWDVHISRDDGYSIHQRFEGGPSAKVPLAPEQVGGRTIVDEHVLGVKTEFIRRGFTQIVFKPDRPIPVPGIVREISVWVAGRELEHDLFLLVKDIEGRVNEVFVDRLNFRGWQQLTAQIPAYSSFGDGVYVGVKQYEPRDPLNSGIEIVALVIKPLFTEAYGTYYVYFDDMRALTDLSVISLRDPDDIIDAW